MKQGAYDFIPKPFEPDQLRIVVNRGAEKIRLLQEATKLEEERRERKLKRLRQGLHLKSATHSCWKSWSGCISMVLALTGYKIGKGHRPG